MGRCKSLHDDGARECYAIRDAYECQGRGSCKWSQAADDTVCAGISAGGISFDGRLEFGVRTETDEGSVFEPIAHPDPSLCNMSTYGESRADPALRGLFFDEAIAGSCKSVGGEQGRRCGPLDSRRACEDAGCAWEGNKLLWRSWAPDEVRLAEYYGRCCLGGTAYRANPSNVACPRKTVDRAYCANVLSKTRLCEDAGNYRASMDFNGACADACADSDACEAALSSFCDSNPDSATCVLRTKGRERARAVTDAPTQTQMEPLPSAGHFVQRLLA